MHTKDFCYLWYKSNFSVQAYHILKSLVFVKEVDADEDFERILDTSELVNPSGKMRLEKIICSTVADDLNIYRSLDTVYIISELKLFVLTKKKLMEGWYQTLEKQFLPEIEKAVDKIAAISFFSRAIGLMQQIFIKDLDTRHDYLKMSVAQFYLAYIPDIETQSSFVVDVLKNFLVDRDPMRFCLFFVRDLIPILDAVQKEKFDCFNLWGCNEEWKLLPSAYLLIHNKDVFACLMVYGLSCEFRMEDWETVPWDSYNTDLLPESMRKRKRPNISKRIVLRCDQVIHLMERRSHRSREVLLKMLWNNITDPFLTKEDFLENMGNNTDMEATLMTALKWYEDLVSGGESSSMTPRSLMHLTRCSIRKNLARNFALPKGVESLTIPQSIKNYLLLDCEIQEIE